MLKDELWTITQKNVEIIVFLTRYGLVRFVELKLHSSHFFEFIQLLFHGTRGDKSRAHM